MEVGVIQRGVHAVDLFVSQAPRAYLPCEASHYCGAMLAPNSSVHSSESSPCSLAFKQRRP